LARLIRVTDASVPDLPRAVRDAGDQPSGVAGRSLIMLFATLIVWTLAGATPASAADPNAPTLNDVTVARDGKVTVSWTDNSAGEDGFSVHRMETTGQFPNQWRSAGDVASRNRPGTGGGYSYTDASSFTVSDGGRCFRVAAYDNAGGLDAISAERCVRAPAPAAAASKPAPPADGSGSSHPPTTASPGGPSHLATTAPPGGPLQSATTAGVPGAAVVRGGDSEHSTLDGEAAGGKPQGRPGTPTSTKVMMMAIVGTVTLALALVALGMEWSRRRRAARVAVPATRPTPPFDPVHPHDG
jgi:hypothetical protein